MTHSRLRISVVVLVFPTALGMGIRAGSLPSNYVAGTMVELNDNGAWSWFMDERVIVDNGRLIVGSVRAIGAYDSRPDDPDWGNVEVASYGIESGRVEKVILHRRLQQDDHNNPAFLVLPDGRYLAVYSKHAVERKVYFCFSEPGDPTRWGPARVFQPPGADTEWAGDNVTYSNLFRTVGGRIFNFFRGYSHDPNYMFSDDDGESWTYGGRLLKGRDGYSPYLKYAFDGRDTIHFIVTEDHPRNYDNGIFHGVIREGDIFLSNGTAVARLSRTTEAPLAAWELTRVFSGDPDNVAWTLDIELDSQKRPVIAFSVQKDGRGLPPRQGGNDLRYYHGSWNGREWQVHQMAYAGSRLYPFEDDYSGLVALDPNDPFVAFISTNADPGTGKPLISQGDGKRHYELYRGRSVDRGRNWQWRALTANSTCDNLRPIVPKWKDPRTALVWMRGTYSNNHGEWTTSVAALILPPE